MAAIIIDNVAKSFGSFVALERVDLHVADAEFVALLGPSGCGKTTLLRIIAGLESQSSCRVQIVGRDVSALAPRKRGLAMVFQNYAVFPHMTVRQNIGFGLRMAGARPARVERQGWRPGALPAIRHKIHPPPPHPGDALGGAAPPRGGRPRFGERALGAGDGGAAVEPRRAVAARDARRV